MQRPFAGVVAARVALAATAANLACMATPPSGRVIGTIEPAPEILTADVLIKDAAYYSLESVTRSRAADPPCRSGLPPERARIGQTILPSGPIDIDERAVQIRFEFAGAAAAPLDPDSTFDVRLRWRGRRLDNRCLRLAVAVPVQ
jgi:hypothetical protein